MRFLLLLVWITASVNAQIGQVARVGSKKFTESVILGEMVRIVAERAGATASHTKEMGGTRILFEALRNGDLDIYPEYTGTIRLDILKAEGLARDGEIPAALARLGLRMSPPLGFSNSYGVAARESWANERGILRISDLRAHGKLELGCSSEFLDRGDGFSPLCRHYRLYELTARGMDHDLAYRGIADSAFDLIMVYTTEAEIEYHDLRVLEDDESFFPSYDAVLLYRAEVADAPWMRRVLELCGRIDNATMIELNGRAKPPRGGGRERIVENLVADAFLEQTFGTARDQTEVSMLQRLTARSLEQLLMVGVSMLLALLVAIPLGIAAARWRRQGQVVLAVCGVLQTLPSLALLVFLLPVFGIGAPTAIAALFVYSLLPIVRNTHSGLTTIPVELVESAQALGLTSGACLRSVYLPMALPAILAGIKTAVVINIGTATLGVFIGAGGYGTPIVTGIRVGDYSLVLEGAVPAALMAVAAQLLFDWLERRLVSPGLAAGPS